MVTCVASYTSHVSDYSDTIMTMDRRAMVSKENEDLRAKEMHDERLLHSHKAQESRPTASGSAKRADLNPTGLQ